MSNICTDIFLESIVTYDDLKLIISTQVVNMFLNKTENTGSPRSMSELNLPYYSFQLARTGSLTLSNI